MRIALKIATIAVWVVCLGGVVFAVWTFVSRFDRRESAIQEIDALPAQLPAF